MIFQDESGDIDTDPSYSCDAEVDDETIGKALLHHCSFRSEKNQRTEDKLITLMICQLSPFSHTRTERPVHELSSCTRNSSRELENARFRILLERQKEQILADCKGEIQKHEFQADYDGRSVQELNGIVESQRREIDQTLAGDQQFRRDQLLLQEQLSEQKSGSS